MNQKLTIPILLGLGAASVAAGVGAYFFLQGRQGPSNLAAAATLVPQDALMTIALSTDPRQWSQLSKYGTPEARSAVEKSLSGFQQSDLLSACQLTDLQKDVQPWIGSSVMIAFLSPSAAANSATPSPTPAPSTGSQQGDMAWIVPVRDGGAARRKFDGLAQAGEGPTEREHQGYTVRELKGQSGAATCSATLLDDKYLVFTSQPQFTDRVIDTYKGQPSLAQLPGYQRASQNIKADNPLGQAYLNLPVLLKAAAEQSQASGQSPAPEALKRAQEWQGMGVTLNLESAGMRFKAVGWLKPDSEQKLTARNIDGQILSQIPADSLLVASGGGLQQTWQESVESSKTNPQLKTSLDNFRTQIKTTTGLDFDQDVIGWMDGEFALALIPSREGMLQDVGAGALLMFQTSNRKAAETALVKLDKTVASSVGLTVGKQQIKSQPVTTWSSPPFGALVAHGWLGDGKTVFLALGTPIVGSVAPKPESPLAASQTFIDATASLPKPNGGYFFLNMQSGLNLLQASPATPTIPPETLAVLKSIGTLGAAGRLEDERTISGELLVTLLSKPAKASEPAPTTP